MRRSLVLRVAAVAVSLGLAATALAGRRDWTGSEACGTCHPRELASWRTSAHATTAARLPPRPPGRCLGCHATGEAPAGPAIAVEVGCEACHGAGAAYAEDDVMRDAPLARALGLVPLATAAERAAVCKTCHAGSTRLVPADLTAPVHP
jgi:hypothetical protein